METISRGIRMPQEQSYKEGAVAKSIESVTALAPSDWFLWGAIGSIGVSLLLMATGEEKKANFVGQFPPTILILGLYNKLVKIAGSDRQS